MKALATVLLMLISSNSYGDEFRLGLGMGVRDEPRLGHLDYIHNISGIFDAKAEAGYSGEMRYGGISVGIKATEGAFFVRYWIGPSLITTTDSYLSSQFQFNHDLEVGIKSKNGIEFMLGWKHMSNAGIVPPNLGRDWVGAGIGIHW